MADKVIHTPDLALNNNSFFKPAITPVQYKCAHCEEEQRKAQRNESNSDTVPASPQIEDYVNSLSGSGRPLNQKERKFFEPRMGHDFSNVRIHTDAEAVRSAQSVNALAYTTGNNIVFNSGQYSPESEGGKRLLSHELTHVVQQGEL